jgi:ABC-type sugar transport system permease subunit
VLQELGAASALAIILGVIVLAISGAISRLSGDS